MTGRTTHSEPRARWTYAPLFLASLALAVACVDLTPPWSRVVPGRDGGAGTDGPDSAGSSAAETSGLGGIGGGSDGGRGPDVGATGGAGGSWAQDASPDAGQSGAEDAEDGPAGEANTQDEPDGVSARDVAVQADAEDGPAGDADVQDEPDGVRAGDVVVQADAEDAPSALDANTEPDALVEPDAPPGDGTGVDVPVDTGGTVVQDAGNAAYNCGSPIVPANRGVNGLVTDFASWNATTAEWGAAAGLHGTIFEYSGGNATINKATVEGSPVGLHLTGSMPSQGYAGGGLLFLVCATVASFSQVQFDIYGGATGCSLEMQIQTNDQRTTDMVPPGTCDAAGGATCMQFPTAKNVTDISNWIGSPRTVTLSVSSFSSWSAANAAQVVALQWQLTGTNITAGSSSIDVTITNIRFQR